MNETPRVMYGSYERWAEVQANSPHRQTFPYVKGEVTSHSFSCDYEPVLRTFYPLCGVLNTNE